MINIDFIFDLYSVNSFVIYGGSIGLSLSYLLYLKYYDKDGYDEAGNEAGDEAGDEAADEIGNEDYNPENIKEAYLAIQQLRQGQEILDFNKNKDKVKKEVKKEIKSKFKDDVKLQEMIADLFSDF